jgi:hypothetical protein
MGLKRLRAWLYLVLLVRAGRLVRCTRDDLMTKH